MGFAPSLRCTPCVAMWRRRVCSICHHVGERGVAVHFPGCHALAWLRSPCYDLLPEVLARFKLELPQVVLPSNYPVKDLEDSKDEGSEGEGDEAAGASTDIGAAKMASGRDPQVYA
ncbi:hypothetical protein E2562_004134 [Oryza meyeriana var. granulata]|uniref:Uncharacterized protein n=1 Tax=Oryza meyeriana var. granulata TaxID=110450 RepID=A0A6G1EV36_9ORYZ|nr:hypothetical protein E2562_004134 [Oryza meyeriana var. granulata]